MLELNMRIIGKMFHSGLRQEYNVNMNGANEKTSYYLSFGYLDDEGYIVKSGFTRYFPFAFGTPV